jgi:hypothetical protein
MSPNEKKQTVIFPLKDDSLKWIFLYFVESHLFMSPNEKKQTIIFPLKGDFFVDFFLFRGAPPVYVLLSQGEAGRLGAGQVVGPGVRLNNKTSYDKVTSNFTFFPPCFCRVGCSPLFPIQKWVYKFTTAS